MFWRETFNAGKEKFRFFKFEFFVASVSIRAHPDEVRLLNLVPDFRLSIKMSLHNEIQYCMILEAGNLECEYRQHCFGNLTTVEN